MTTPDRQITPLPQTLVIFRPVDHLVLRLIKLVPSGCVELMWFNSQTFRISALSVNPRSLEIYFSGTSHHMTAPKLTSKTTNKPTNGTLTDPSFQLFTVDVVIVDVAQPNEVIDRVRSPILMTPVCLVAPGSLHLGLEFRWLG